ncbi:MAG: hypothetical protein JSR49_13960 [Proteobacteria bacterium]|nr:hypothetical protein [Pseudomonadota bacterium]
MRTTLDLAEDVLAAVKELAYLENSTAGAVLSRLARQAMLGGDKSGQPSGRSIAGLRTLPRRGHLVTAEEVNELRDQEGV